MSWILRRKLDSYFRWRRGCLARRRSFSDKGRILIRCVDRLLDALFPILTTTPSKSLRALLFQKILSDLRTSNAQSKDHRLNRNFQTLLFNLVTTERDSPKGLWAVKITRELWKRQIWTESKAVEIMKEASLADNDKVVVGGVRFFLVGDQEREDLEDESSDDDAMTIGQVKHQMAINKKNRKKAKLMDNAVATVKRKEKKKKAPPTLNFSALHLLHDPQSFAENLFSKHVQNSRSKLNLEKRLQVLQLVSRLVGLHKLTIVSLYSYFLKYLSPRQHSVTSFLASLAQATHNQVPPDVLEPLVLKIANEFVSEAAAAEVASAGLNAIREICLRQPLAMNDTLLQDLVMYRKSKDKGVVMAARGLLGLYREVGAEMLKKKDRGKDVIICLKKGTQKAQRFGEEPIGEIEGLELLEEWKKEERRKKRLEKGLPAEKDPDEAEQEDEEEEGEDAADWEVDNEEDSNDSGGWIDVESDRDIDVSDSDDEKPRAKRAKTSPTAAQHEEDEKVLDEGQKAVAVDTAKSDLATTRILTPADLAKLHELRISASISAHLPQSKQSPNQRTQRNIASSKTSSNLTTTRHPDDPLTADQIAGLAALSKGKPTKAEKVAMARAGVEDEEREFRKKGKEAKRRDRKEAAGKSSTNKEKARKKNFLMTLGKGKGKARAGGGLVGKAKQLKIQKGKQRGKGGFG